MEREGEFRRCKSSLVRNVLIDVTLVLQIHHAQGERSAATTQLESDQPSGSAVQQFATETFCSLLTRSKDNKFSIPRD